MGREIFQGDNCRFEGGPGRSKKKSKMAQCGNILAENRCRMESMNALGAHRLWIEARTRP
jgi:hypothetical protein